MAIQHRAKTERVYVKVDSSFDPTGFMQPTSITWSDGRTFPIEIVRDFRPAGTADNGYSGDCFTVLILKSSSVFEQLSDQACKECRFFPVFHVERILQAGQ